MDHKWVIYVGHIRIVFWVSGSNGSTGVTHFQPCSIFYIVALLTCLLYNIANTQLALQYTVECCPGYSVLSCFPY